jgi:hypothetical protein
MGEFATSVFDKAAEWQFPFLDTRILILTCLITNLLVYFKDSYVVSRVICNSLKAFKVATTQLVLRMFSRGHKTAALIKGWNKHLAAYSNDRITNYTRLRQWFRRMLCWASHHPLQPFDKSINSKSTLPQPAKKQLSHNSEKSTITNKPILK